MIRLLVLKEDRVKYGNLTSFGFGTYRKLVTSKKLSHKVYWIFLNSARTRLLCNSNERKSASGRITCFTPTVTFAYFHIYPKELND